MSTRPELRSDSSVWSLVAANAIALLAAIAYDWSLVSLMAVYWTQSVVIGVSNAMRMLALDEFSTENFTINDRPVDPTPETKRKVAGFFLMHYGIFHAVYFFFLFTTPEGLETFGDLGFWICAVAFAANHRFSYRYHREVDRRGTPNIGTLMFTPYLRIVPMHLLIVFGAHVAHSTVAVVAFGVLKTVADVAMHWVEHAQLGKVRGPRRANGQMGLAER